MTKIEIFMQKLKFIYPLVSITDAQATGEAFSPRKGTSSTSKNGSYELFLVFTNFVGHFDLLDRVGTGLRIRIWIRIANPDLDKDPGTPLNPDPQH